VGESVANMSIIAAYYSGLSLSWPMLHLMLHLENYQLKIINLIKIIKIISILSKCSPGCGSTTLMQQPSSCLRCSLNPHLVGSGFAVGLISVVPNKPGSSTVTLSCSIRWCACLQKLFFVNWMVLRLALGDLTIVSTTNTTLVFFLVLQQCRNRSSCCGRRPW
jgi:hypothetical protein